MTKLTIKEATQKAKEAISVLNDRLFNHDCNEEKCTQFYKGECEARLSGATLYYP